MFYFFRTLLKCSHWTQLAMYTTSVTMLTWTACWYSTQYRQKKNLLPCICSSQTGSRYVHMHWSCLLPSLNFFKDFLKPGEVFIKSLTERFCTRCNCIVIGLFYRLYDAVHPSSPNLNLECFSFPGVRDKHVLTFFPRPLLSDADPFFLPLVGWWSLFMS